MDTALTQIIQGWRKDNIILNRGFFRKPQHDLFEHGFFYSKLSWETQREIYENKSNPVFFVMPSRNHFSHMCQRARANCNEMLQRMFSTSSPPYYYVDNPTKYHQLKASTSTSKQPAYYPYARRQYKRKSGIKRFTMT